MIIRTDFSGKCGVCGKYFNNVSIRDFFQHLELDHCWNIDDWNIED